MHPHCLTTLLESGTVTFGHIFLVGENLVIWLPLTLRMVKIYHQGYFWETYLGIILQGNYCDQLFVSIEERKKHTFGYTNNTTLTLFMGLRENH